MALLNVSGGGFRLSTPPTAFNLASGWTLHITFMGLTAPGNGPFGAGSSVFETNGGSVIRVHWDSTNTARRGSVVMYSNYTDGIIQIPNLTTHKWYEVTAGHDGTYFWVRAGGFTERMVKDPFSGGDVNGLTLFNATDGYYSFENGKIARATLWNQSLSQSEVAYLQSGGHTQAVRRGAQMANWDRLLTPTRAIDYTGRGNDMDQPYGSFAVTNGPAYPPIRLLAVPAASSSGYTLTAAGGTFTLSGQAVALKAARLLSLSNGALTLSGQAVALKAARRILTDYATYTLSGQAVALSRGRLPLTAEAGTFALTGQDIALKAGFLLSASTALYTVTGRDATLTYSGEVASAPSVGGTRRNRKGFRRILLPVEQPAVAYQASSVPPELKAQAKKAWQDDDDEWILLA